MSKKTPLIDKTSISNISAGAIVFAGITYGLWKGDGELIKNMVMLALGYLFGKAAVKQ